jgi:hypothetical protein
MRVAGNALRAGKRREALRLDAGGFCLARELNLPLFESGGAVAA